MKTFKLFLIKVEFLPKNGRFNVENFRPLCVIFFVINMPCHHAFYLTCSNQKVPKYHLNEVLDILLHYIHFNNDLKKCVCALHYVSQVSQCLVSHLQAKVDNYSGYETYNVEVPRKTNSLFVLNPFNSHYWILEIFLKWPCPKWNEANVHFKILLLSALSELSYRSFRLKASPRNAL